MAILKHLTKYCNAVLDGKVIACQKYKWACTRFLNDLKRRKLTGLAFDETKAGRYYDWMRLFKHSKGELAGQKIEPCDYQLFVYGNIYGWIDRDGNRRFRKSYQQLARKNGKSQAQAIQALFEMSAFGEPRAEIYVMSTKKAQNRHVYSEANWLIKNSILKNSFTYKFHSEFNDKIITHPRSGSTFVSLSADDKKNSDGSNAHFAIIDEYHAHQTSEFLDVMASGMTTRKNSLISIITTAGFELSHPCYRVEYKFVSDLLSPGSPIEDDTYFAVVCELDQDDDGNIIDDLGTDTAILKANPVTGNSPTVRQNILMETRAAKYQPDKYRNLITKNYNVWYQQKPCGYMNMSKWSNCKASINQLMETIRYKTDGKCYVGLDLSSKIDLTSVSFVFPYDDAEIAKYALLSHSFTPEEQFHSKIKTDKVPYDLWRKQGYLTVTDGAVVDYQHVLKWVTDFLLEHELNPVEFCIDPWGSAAVSNHLQNDGHTVVEVVQGMKTLAYPTKTFREMVFSKRIIHDDNPVLNWAVGNAVTRSDHNGNIMLDKSKATQRIDPVAAAITAFTRALAASAASEEVGFGVMFI